MKAIGLIFGTLLLSASAYAASIQYTFTFDATTLSSLTSYSLTVPALLSGSNSFTGDKAHLVSGPAPGATFIPVLPSVFVNSTGSVGAYFTQRHSRR